MFGISTGESQASSSVRLIAACNDSGVEMGTSHNGFYIMITIESEKERCHMGRC